MQDFLFDKVNIIPEAKRRRRSRSRGRGFFGGILSTIGAVIIIILAVIMLPFILIRNRRNPSNDVLINDNNINNTQSHNDKINLKK